MFRGAYPTKRNFRFLRRLKLKTIVSVTPEPPKRDLLEFCEREGVVNLHFHVEKFSDAVTISSSRVAHILEIMVQIDRHPLFLHCLDGAHVTGHIVMCLRKLQNWNLSVVYAEFCRFTKGGEISRDESQFVESFKGELSIPEVVPMWLWGGVRINKHPTIRIKPLASLPSSLLIPSHYNTPSLPPTPHRADSGLESLESHYLTSPTLPRARSCKFSSSNFVCSLLLMHSKLDAFHFALAVRLDGRERVRHRRLSAIELQDHTEELPDSVNNEADPNITLQTRFVEVSKRTGNVKQGVMSRDMAGDSSVPLSTDSFSPNLNALALEGFTSFKRNRLHLGMIESMI